MPQARRASLLGLRAEVHLEKFRSFSRSGGWRGGAVAGCRRREKGYRPEGDFLLRLNSGRPMGPCYHENQNGADK